MMSAFDDINNKLSQTWTPIEKLIWLSKSGLTNPDLTEQAAAELARLQAIEQAAREIFRKPALGVYSDSIERYRLDQLKAALERKP